MTTATTEPRNIPLPAGAESVDRWEVDRDERVTRMFSNAERGTVIRAGIVGKQDYSGEVLHRVILVELPLQLVELDAAGARRAAADLLAVADELDRLDGTR